MLTPLSDAALAPALIGGSAALVVALLTQFTTARRDHANLLTSKLEELYTLLNEASEKNVEYLQLYRAFSQVPSPDLANRLAQFQLFSSSLHKRVILYVRLYFPGLTAAHIALFTQLQMLHSLLYEALNGQEVPAADLDAAFFGFGDHLRAFEQEMIDNKSLLIGRLRLRFRYRRAPVISPWAEALLHEPGPLAADARNGIVGKPPSPAA